jgi:hypothetical protein
MLSVRKNDKKQLMRVVVVVVVVMMINIGHSIQIV